MKAKKIHTDAGTGKNFRPIAYCRSGVGWLPYCDETETLKIKIPCLEDRQTNTIWLNKTQHPFIFMKGAGRGRVDPLRDQTEDSTSSTRIEKKERQLSFFLYKLSSASISLFNASATSATALALINLPFTLGLLSAFTFLMW